MEVSDWIFESNKGPESNRVSCSGVSVSAYTCRSDSASKVQLALLSPVYSPLNLRLLALLNRRSVLYAPNEGS
jgi:hypothetical protein